MQDNDLQGMSDGLGLRAGDGPRTPDNQINSGGPSRNDATTSRVRQPKEEIKRQRDDQAAGEGAGAQGEPQEACTNT